MLAGKDYGPDCLGIVDEAYVGSPADEVVDVSE